MNAKSQVKIQNVGDLLGQLMNSLGIADRVYEQRVLQEFDRIMGPEFCRRVHAVKIDRGVLFLQVASSAWRQELYYQKQLIRDRLNGALGERLVKEIILA